MAGLAAHFTGILQPPNIFWPLVAALTVAIAGFQLFHKERLLEGKYAVNGPPLPQLIGLGLDSNHDATYLTVIGCSQDPKPAHLSTSKSKDLEEELVEVLGIADKSPDRSSYYDGFLTTLSDPQQVYLGSARLDITGAVCLKVEWSLGSGSIHLAPVLIRAVDGVRALRRSTCASVLGKHPWIVIVLNPGPEFSISTEGLLTCQPWSNVQHHRPSKLFSRPKQCKKDWPLVLDFAEKLLADVGCVDFETDLRTITEAQTRRILCS
ncbi:MAG: hypothetical protein ACREN8_06205 [Candidatus Dormibacteraceae bacterium]